jgi:acyl-CoA thioesterase-1
MFVTATHGDAQDKATKKKKKTRRVSAVFQPITDDPNLPRVLLLGDSISIGYTLPVRELLKGKANVHRAPTNCGPTTKGVASIDEWLGSGKWDVIHFNWGLHDLKYMGPNGENLADPEAADSHQQVPVEQYEENLQKLVARMKRTNAKLIWCATTPVPAGAKGRVAGDSATYNAAAGRVMQAHDIPTNDLFAFAKAKLNEIQQPANVHFTPAGSKELGEKVAEAILAQLE